MVATAASVNGTAATPGDLTVAGTGTPFGGPAAYSTLDLGSNTLAIGLGGSGSVTIGSGGKIITSLVQLGGNGGSGTLTIDGVQPYLGQNVNTLPLATGPSNSDTTPPIQFGPNTIPPAGSGSQGTATLNVTNGAYLQQPSMTVGGANLVVSTLNVSGTGATASGGAVGAMLDLGSNTLAIGLGGSGSVAVANGGRIVAGTISLGPDSAGNGSLLVTTGGSISAGAMQVGSSFGGQGLVQLQGGTIDLHGGTLTVSNGGLGGSGTVAAQIVVAGEGDGTLGTIDLSDGRIGTLILSDPNADTVALQLGGNVADSPSLLLFDIGTMADNLLVTAGMVEVGLGGGNVEINPLDGFGPGTYDLIDFPAGTPLV